MLSNEEQTDKQEVSVTGKSTSPQQEHATQRNEGNLGQKEAQREKQGEHEMSHMGEKSEQKSGSHGGTHKK